MPIVSVWSFKVFESFYKTSNFAKEGDVLLSNFILDFKEEVRVPFFKESPGFHTLEMRFGKLESSQPVVFLSYIDGNNLKIFVNDNLVGISGNPFDTRSLRWNRPEVYFIPLQVLKDSNVLRMEVETENTIGIFDPVFVGEYKHIQKSYLSLYFVTQFLNTIYIVLFLVVGIMFILVPILVKSNYHRALIGISLIMFALYFVDYGYIPHLPISYVIYKKIVISSLYVALGLYLVGFTSEFGFSGNWRKVSSSILILNAGCALLLILKSGGGVAVRRTYLILNFTVFLTTMMILYIFLRKIFTSEGRKNPIAILNGVAILYFIPYVVRDVYVLMTFKPVPLLNQYALAVFITMNLLFVIFDFAGVYRRLLLEKKKVQFLEMESMRDPLTGALNRRFLFKIAEIIPESYSLCIVDIDGFKRINDTYGHLIGDCVLRKLASSLMTSLRKDDHVVRYGGDEFVILFHNTDEETAQIGIEKMKRYVKDRDFNCEGTVVRVSFSYGLCVQGEYSTLDEMLKKADERLYINKKSGGETLFA